MKTKILTLSVLLVFSTVLLSGQGMIIQPGAYVSVINGGKLIITGATDGKLTIKSTSAGTGSLLVDNTAGSAVTVPENNAYVERYLAVDQWHYISSPVSNAVSGLFLGDYLKTSDQTTALGWGGYIVPVNVVLDPMRGYAVWKPTVNASWKEVFSGGYLNNGNLSINIGWAAGTWAGWHLVGNPYPCAMNLSTGVTWTNVEATVWFWNGSAGNYQAWPTNGLGTGIYNGGTHSNIVPAMQGFFVHSTNAIASLAFTNATRVNNAEPFLKSTPDPHLVIKATGYINSYFDIVSIQFNPTATPGYNEGCDALKLAGYAEAPQLYTLINDTNVTCNALPFNHSTITVPMGFSCGLSGDYTLIADSLQTFDPAISITLEDLQVRTTQNLRTNPVYEFSYATTDDPKRFLLHFNNPTFGTSEILANTEPVQIYSYGNSVYIRKTGTDPLNGQLFVYDPLGKELYNSNVDDSPLSKYNLSLSTGYYLVKVVTGASVYSKKVFING
jgi:hypothetical protein